MQATPRAIKPRLQGGDPGGADGSGTGQGTTPEGGRHDEAVRRQFDQDAGRWHAYYSADTVEGRVYKARLEAVLEWVDRCREHAGRALDVGCGAGELVAELAARSWQVDACDVSDEMLAIVRERGLPQVRLHNADVYALPFEDGAFDLVTALGVVPWLHSPQRGMSEIARVTRPGGVVIVTADNRRRLTHMLDPRRTPLLSLARRPLRPLRRRRHASAGLHRQHDLRQFLALLRDTGLEVLSTRTVGFGPFTLMGKPIIPERAGISLNTRLQRLADRRRSPLRTGGAHLLVLTRKPEHSSP